MSQSGDWSIPLGFCFLFLFCFCFLMSNEERIYVDWTTNYEEELIEC
jgi:hypothetical protein